MGVFHHGSKSEYLDHFHAAHGDGWAVLGWDTRGDTPREVMVFRSEIEFAPEGSDPTTDGQQALVYQGTESHSHVQDKGLVDNVDYFYSVFVKGDDGAWHEQLKKKVTPKEDFHYKRQDVVDESKSLEQWDNLRVGFLAY